ncbi:MAG: nitroreductase family protein, partial [Finegoldia magna]|nr:nitroreductase family protein [Finegoldia magna]
MDILELMHKRHSVRKYLDEEIDISVKKIIEEKVDEVNRESNLNIKAVFDDKEGFNSRLAKYGKFENVNNFLIMKGVGNDLSETCGYYGEKLVMELMNLDLGSCWVALTYNKKNIKKYIEPNENLVIVISFGIPANLGYNRKSKLPKQVSNVNDDSPQWFKDGVDCALNAPTAINQQKVMLTWVDDKVE